MNDNLRAAYEAAPYDIGPIDGTHVSQLETMGLLHGISAAPNGRCRALELGCGTGGNLIAMAYGLPDARFVGIDLAPNQIADGKRLIAALGLTNIELRAMSIGDVGPELGLFDYIISHGVYSWVPADVSDEILRVSSSNLAPNGIAYVSYNTYPGWHLRGMVRDMLMFHDDPTLPPADRVARARAFAHRLTTAGIGSSSSLHATMLSEEVRVVRGQSDTHLLHEQLESFNRPVYFTEFVKHAAAHRLQYVTESHLAAGGRRSSEWVKDAAGTEPVDAIRSQQYLDFVGGRAFRSTLLCHDSIAVRDAPSADQMPMFHFWTTATSAEPTAEEASNGGGTVSFQTHDTRISTNVPLVIAAVRSLVRASPDVLSFDELLGRVEDRLQLDAVPGITSAPSAQSVATRLAEALLQCAHGGLIRLDRRAPKLATRISAHPRASLLGREQARRAAFALGFQHGRVSLTAADRLVLVHLDGTRTRDDLLGVIQDAVASGALTLDGAPPDPAALPPMLDAILRRFAAAGLLEA